MNMNSAARKKMKEEKEVIGSSSHSEHPLSHYHKIPTRPHTHLPPAHPLTNTLFPLPCDQAVAKKEEKKKSAVGAVETGLVYALTCPQGKKYVGKTQRTS